LNETGWSNGLPNLETKAVFAADFISTTDISANEMDLLPDVNLIISDTHLNRCQRGKSGRHK
jgi:hypothetical protein